MICTELVRKRRWLGLHRWRTRLLVGSPWCQSPREWPYPHRSNSACTTAPTAESSVTAKSSGMNTARQRSITSTWTRTENISGTTDSPPGECPEPATNSVTSKWIMFYLNWICLQWNCDSSCEFVWLIFVCSPSVCGLFRFLSNKCMLILFI